MKHIRFLASLLVAASWAAIAHADQFSGTVQLEGQVTFAAPIPGISATDVEVSVRESTEATGNGEKCEITATSSDHADAFGLYGGTVSAVSVTITISRGGGPQLPTGECIITVQARGTDGVSTSARGSQTIFLAAADIDASATVAVPTIILRESKAVAGVSKDCLKWTKKQMIKRAKCNFLLLKLGPAAALKCKDAGLEPPDCDPGEFVAAELTLAHGSNDQQVDPMNAEGVDYKMLRDQVKCQKRFGKAAAKFVAKRNKLVQKACIDAATDSDTCRENQSKTAKKKLDQIDKCATEQLVDGGTGRVVPDTGVPCDVCISGGQLDRKCMKSCFEIALDEISDGIVQPNGGEFCDDGNTDSGDCCSSSCAVEMGNPEGPMGDPTCADGLDNDCDGLIDGADSDCQ